MITIYPKIEEVTNNFLIYPITDSRTLILYLIQESFQEGSRPVELNTFVVQYNYNVEDVVSGVLVTNIIGVSDVLLSIKTTEPALEGQPLTADNLDLVYFEVYDGE